MKKISCKDIWSDPRCCHDAMEWLSTRVNCFYAWADCTNPQWLCWFLDYWQQRALLPDEGPSCGTGAGVALALSNVMPLTAAWRLTMYDYFLKYEMNFSRPARWIILHGLKKNRRLALYFFFLVNGYFEDARGKRAEWWGLVLDQLKEDYDEVTSYLSYQD